MAGSNFALGGPPDGELVLKAAGKFLRGWENVTVARSVETVPSLFDIAATTKYPGQLADAIPVSSPLQILIGGKVVLTGYLDATAMSIGPEQHDLRYHGRGRLSDIVDSSIDTDNLAFNKTTITELAKRLVEGFAGPIQVISPDGDGDSKPLDYAADLGETPYEAIERYARYEGLLVYENADGNLVLSRAGKVKHSSGFAEGQNVQSAEFVTDFSQRFSTYLGLIISQDMLARGGAMSAKRVPDPAITRYRPRVIISEQANGSQILATQRAQWEAQRRRGRSMRVTLVADSWLDSAGTPWTPNQVAPVSIPSLGLDAPDWVITDTVHRRDGRSGTTCQVTLMPKDALALEPILLNPYENRALTSGQSSSPTGPAGSPTSSVTAPNAENDGRRDRGS